MMIGSVAKVLLCIHGIATVSADRDEAERGSADINMHTQTIVSTGVDCPDEVKGCREIKAFLAANAAAAPALQYFDVDGNGQLDEAEAKRVLEIAKLFRLPAEVAQLMTTLKYFGGGDARLQRKEMKDMKRAVGYFDTASDRNMTKMTQEFDKFDFPEKDGKLDGRERNLLMTMLTFFAGPDKKFQQPEIEDMDKVIGYFDGEDDKLVSREAQTMVDTLDQFDPNEDGVFDDDERKTLITELTYFAGDNGELEQYEIADLNKAIGYFDANGNGAIDECEGAQMQKIMGMYDFPPKDQKLDVEERKLLMETLTYLAGKNKRLEDDEIRDMFKLIGFFDGADNILDKAEAGNVALALPTFDLDANGYLDDAERRMMITTVQYFAGDDMELQQEEFQALAALEEPFEALLKSQGMEIVEFLEFLALFDGDGDQDLDAEESASLIATVDYFANQDQDKALSESELDQMLKTVRFYAGLDGRIDSEEGKKMKDIFAKYQKKSGVLVAQIESAMIEAYASVEGS